MRETFANIAISIATNTALFTGLDLGQWIADTLSLWMCPPRDRCHDRDGLWSDPYRGDRILGISSANSETVPGEAVDGRNPAQLSLLGALRSPRW